jgi:membrane protein DedA with SNARE-associated domain
MTIEGLISHYGLAAIFLGAGTEGEAAAVAGGLVAHRQLIPLWQVGAAVYAGSLLAGQALFLAGRRFRDTPWIRKQTGRPIYATVLRALERRPVGYILIYRFVFGVRTLTPLVLGGTQIPTLRFTLLNALAAAIWSAVFTGLGYGFGKTVERLFGRLPSGPHLVMIAIVVAAVAAGAWGFHRMRRRPSGAGR